MEHIKEATSYDLQLKPYAYSISANSRSNFSLF